MTVPAWTTHRLNPGAAKVMADDGATAAGGYLLAGDSQPPDTVSTGATSGSPHPVPAIPGVPVRVALTTPAASFLTTPASPVDGQTFSVRDASGNAATNNITITAVGSGTTINGATTYVINVNGAEPAFRYVQATNNWDLIGPPQGASVIANLLDQVASGGCQGVPSASQWLGSPPLPHAILLPTGLAGSVAKSRVAATGTVVCSVLREHAGTETAFATITFAAGSKIGTFAVTGSLPTLADGDSIVVLAPSTPDATLADISFSILGTKQ